MPIRQHSSPRTLQSCKAMGRYPVNRDVQMTLELKCCYRLSEEGSFLRATLRNSSRRGHEGQPSLPEQQGAAERGPSDRQDRDLIGCDLDNARRAASHWAQPVERDASGRHSSRVRKNSAVVPGWPLGPGPEPMDTGHATDFSSQCHWIPGSRATPAPRNDPFQPFSAPC